MAGASQEICMSERTHLTACLVPADCVFVTESKLLCQRRERGIEGKQLSYLNTVNKFILDVLEYVTFS